MNPSSSLSPISSLLLLSQAEGEDLSIRDLLDYSFRIAEEMAESISDFFPGREIRFGRDRDFLGWEDFPCERNLFRFWGIQWISLLEISEGRNPILAEGSSGNLLPAWNDAELLSAMIFR